MGVISQARSRCWLGKSVLSERRKSYQTDLSLPGSTAFGLAPLPKRNSSVERSTSKAIQDVKFRSCSIVNLALNACRSNVDAINGSSEDSIRNLFEM